MFISSKVSAKVRDVGVKVCRSSSQPAKLWPFIFEVAFALLGPPFSSASLQVLLSVCGNQITDDDAQD